jgi:hypothetical protein
MTSQLGKKVLPSFVLAGRRRREPRPRPGGASVTPCAAPYVRRADGIAACESLTGRSFHERRVDPALASTAERDMGRRLLVRQASTR